MTKTLNDLEAELVNSSHHFSTEDGGYYASYTKMLMLVRKLRKELASLNSVSVDSSCMGDFDEHLDGDATKEFKFDDGLDTLKNIFGMK